MPVYKFVQDSLQVSALGLSPSVPPLFIPGTTLPGGQPYSIRLPEGPAQRSSRWRSMMDREPGSEIESKPVASSSANLGTLLDFLESFFLHF